MLSQSLWEQRRGVRAGLTPLRRGAPAVKFTDSRPEDRLLPGLTRADGQAGCVPPNPKGQENPQGHQPWDGKSRSEVPPYSAARCRCEPGPLGPSKASEASDSELAPGCASVRAAPGSNLGSPALGPWLQTKAQQSENRGLSPHTYLQVIKGQAGALAAVTPALVVDSVQDGEAVQAVARQRAQRAKQPGEQVVHGDPGSPDRHTTGGQHRGLSQVLWHLHPQCIPREESLPGWAAPEPQGSAQALAVAGGLHAAGFHACFRNSMQRAVQCEMSGLHIHPEHRGTWGAFGLATPFCGDWRLPLAAAQGGAVEATSRWQGCGRSRRSLAGVMSLLHAPLWQPASTE